jgi:hypothetical protein
LRISPTIVRISPSRQNTSPLAKSMPFDWDCNGSGECLSKLGTCVCMFAHFNQLAFVVPLGVKPNQCFDQITPNDMYTNMTCAFSGAFIVGGGLVVSVWSKWPESSIYTATDKSYSLHASTFHAPSDMLGYRPWRLVLLYCSSCRMGRSSHPFYSHHDFNWCLFSIRRHLPHQL